MAEQKGSVEIFTDRCKGCGLCVSVCPVHIIVLAEKAVNIKGYFPATITSPATCTGCGHCTLMCPDSAITVKRYSRKVRRSNG